MTPGRNDPCPCGSGKKYKKCCELTNRPVLDADTRRASTAKEIDRRLSERILRFARMRMGPECLRPALDRYTGEKDGTVDDAELQIAIPWAMYGFRRTEDDLTLAEVFYEENASQLSPELLGILDANLRSWMSIWEVQSVNPGTGVQVTDLLTGEERFVHEISASRSLTVRDCLLASVVDSYGISFFGGTHHQPLGPRDADEAVKEMRRLCRVRTRPVKHERLGEIVVQVALIYLWRTLVERARNSRAPMLTNTDGDPINLTTDHFDVLAHDRSILLSRLAMIPGAEDAETDDRARAESVIVLTKSGNARMKSMDNTIIGRMVISGNRMRVESNSTRRADALRESILAHAGELVRHRLRDETSQAELLRVANEGSSREPVKPYSDHDAESAAIVKAFREKHMLAWLDDEIPALNGLTPREAMKSPRSRKDLELLLREFENNEARLPENQRFDVNRLRDELGIPR